MSRLIGIKVDERGKLILGARLKSNLEEFERKSQESGTIPEAIALGRLMGIIEAMELLGLKRKGEFDEFLALKELEVWEKEIEIRKSIATQNIKQTNERHTNTNKTTDTQKKTRDDKGKPCMNWKECPAWQLQNVITRITKLMEEDD